MDSIFQRTDLWV